MCAPTPTLQSCIPFPLSEDDLVDVVDKAKDWAIMHGAAMRSKQEFNPDGLQFAPFILTPSSFPRVEFQKAVALQPVLNELIHAIAHDSAFLFDTLKSTVKVDDFTRSLIDIYRTVLDEGIAQPISLGLLRSDLMLETRCNNECGEPANPLNAYCCWKQVEINTIASGFGHLGPSSKSLQSRLASTLSLVNPDAWLVYHAWKCGAWPEQKPATLFERKLMRSFSKTIC